MGGNIPDGNFPGGSFPDTASDVSLIHTRNSRGRRIDPYVALLGTHAGWENKFPELTRKSSIYKIRWN